jgi:diguanylate cyclase (GGDEF)-like protein
MAIKRLSMRAGLTITIVALGLLAMAVPLWTGDLYRSVVGDSQESALADQLRASINAQHQNFQQEIEELGWTLQNDPAFMRALAERRVPALENYLDAWRERRASVFNDNSIVRVAILDRAFAPIAASTRAVSSPPRNLDACNNLRVAAAARANTLVARPAHDVCVAGKLVLHAVIVQVGEPESAGYIEVLADVVRSVRDIEVGLGIPLRLTLPDGTVVYQSRQWPAVPGDRGVIAEFPVTGAFVRNAPRLAAYKNLDVFFDRFDQAGYLVIAITGMVTVLAVALALIVLDRKMLVPMRALATQVRKVQHDKVHLGQHIEVGGTAEMAELGACFNDMTAELRRLYEGLERAAFTDSLTELPNRALFHDRLKQAIFTARREQKTFALFIMDLDRFKDINDTLGHQVGDEVLKQVAQRLRTKLRESDTIARMGGDEFAVLLPTVNAKYAAMAARMLLQALRTPFSVGDQTLDVGASIGIALYPDHGVDVNVLIQRADVAMYAAKHSNVGHAFYESRLDDNNPSRLALMSELRRAVELEQFVLFFQPIVDLTAGKVVGAEALLRWNHPNDGVIRPDMFVPLLEQTGLIRNVTPWVLNEAMRVGRTLREQGMPLVISINLSVRDLQDPFLAETLSEQLQANEVRPEWIKLEITESAVMTEPERSLELLRHLSRMGMGLAIDDFGTGYSSLTYLKRLPVSTIKVDKSFVSGMAGDPDDAAIVRTAIDLARNLGLEVVAEGVDSEETLHRLEELGCNMVQGHYVSRPLTEEEFGVWLRQSFWGLQSGAALGARPHAH